MGAVAPSGDATGYAGGGCSSTTYATTPGWCMYGKAEAGSTTGDGGLEGVQGLAADPATDSLFVINSITAASRVERYALSTGTYQGWVGKVSTLPTSNGPGAHPDCATTSVLNTVTPGWCIGGASDWGEEDGALADSSGVSSDGTYVYVTQTWSHRVNRYLISDGTYQGWIGGINNGGSPTGGAAGCAGVTTVTPGWCTGGSSAVGTSDGAFSSSHAVQAFGNRLYVADDTRISVFDLAQSGAAGFFDGWIGQIATPTSGWNSTPAATAATPGGQTDGALSGMAAFSDGSHLYVTEHDASRLKKFDTGAGTLVGWAGIIATWPTSGGGNCMSGPSWGTYVFGWCLGGETTGGFGGLGGLMHPGGVWGDGTSIYVHNNNNHTISRYLASDASFTGWIGLIGTQPTGGDPGCTDATGHPPGTFTPGWCTGGDAANPGSPYVADGSIRDSYTSASGMTGHGNWIYTVESYDNRVHRYNRTTGAFAGWIGRVSAISPSGDADGSPGGCAATADGDVTPGWCLGGTSKDGTGDGMLNLPQGLATDGTYLYVGSSNIRHINRYDLTTGEFKGWLGRVGTVPPTGGNGGCIGAAVNTASPGWCFGGDDSGVLDHADGTFVTPLGLAYNAGYLYVVEGEGQFVQAKVQKFRVSTPVPTFVGWKGAIGSTAGLGGGAGCSSATVGTFTPDWCTGGAAQKGTGQGMFTKPVNLTADSAYLYVLDATAGRMVRINR